VVFLHRREAVSPTVFESASNHIAQAQAENCGWLKRRDRPAILYPISATPDETEVGWFPANLFDRTELVDHQIGDALRRSPFLSCEGKSKIRHASIVHRE